MLIAASREIGGPQIQARGTIGGNIANASPAGDTLPVLAASDAIVVLASIDGERRVPFTTFYTGYRQTVRRPDELIVAVEVPPIEGKQWFRKVGTRAAQAISRLVMAAVRAPVPRIALGSVAPTVVRLPRTEAALAAGHPIADARQVLAAEIHPIDDVRATAGYRTRVAQISSRSSGPIPHRERDDRLSFTSRGASRRGTAGHRARARWDRGSCVCMGRCQRWCRHRRRGRSSASPRSGRHPCPYQ